MYNVSIRLRIRTGNVTVGCAATERARGERTRIVLLPRAGSSHRPRSNDCRRLNLRQRRRSCHIIIVVTTTITDGGGGWNLSRWEDERAIVYERGGAFWASELRWERRKEGRKTKRGRVCYRAVGGTKEKRKSITNIIDSWLSRRDVGLTASRLLVRMTCACACVLIILYEFFPTRD